MRHSEARTVGAAVQETPSSRRVIDLSTVALGVLLVAVTLGRYSWNIAGYNVKLEHIAIACVLIATLVVRLAGDRRRNLIRLSSLLPLLWTLPYLGVLALSSVVNSPDAATSLRHTAMLALVMSGAWLVYILTGPPERFRLAVWMLVGLGLLEAAVTYVALVASSLGLTFGTQVGIAGITVPYGTLWEPNILGSFLAGAGTILLSRLVLSGLGRRDVYRLVVGLVLLLSALGLSLARASWIGFAVGSLTVLFCYAWVQRRKLLQIAIPWRRVFRAMEIAALGTLLMLGVVAPLAFPNTFQGIFVRLDFRYFSIEKDPSVQARVTSFQGAMEGIAAHPIIGNGTGSYGIEHVGEHGEPGWIGNLELHTMYDGGVVGLALLLGGLGLLIRRAWRAATSSLPHATPETESRVRADIIGLLGATVALLVAFQATEGTWLGYSWVYFGLLARAGSLSLSSKEGQEGVQEYPPDGVVGVSSTTPSKENGVQGDLP